MSKGINKVTLIGNLGDDPDIKYTSSGTAIANLSVATSENWTDKQTGEKQERTEWHRVVFFGRMAEVCGEYLTKGRQVYIEGSLRTEKYTDKEGIERYATKVYGSEMQMLGVKAGEGTPPRGGRAERPARGGGYGEGALNPAREQKQESFADDEIPF